MDLEKKLEQIKPYQLNCSVFSVYDYDECTIQELLCRFFETINNCVDLCNNVLDLCKWLVSVGLEQEVAKKLDKWLEDGTLAEIINDKLFKELNEKINTNKIKIDLISYVCNSSEDIGNEVNEAIKQGYKSIKIPSGEYNLITSIELDSNVEIYGDKDTILKRNIDKPFIKSPNFKLTNECYIHDLTFISDSISGNLNYDLHLCNPNMFKIERIKIVGDRVGTNSRIGLYCYKENENIVGTAYSINLDKLDFRNASLIMGVTDSYLTNSNIWSQDLSNCVWLQCSSHQILNCQFVGNDRFGAIRAEHPSGHILELIKINNCYFDGSYVDIESGNAILFKNVFSSIINSCNIWKQKKNGIILEYCDSVTISNNSFRDNGIKDDRGYYDIIFMGGCANCLITNNTYLSTELDRRNKTIAIDLSQAVNVVNSVFENNIVRDSNNYSDSPFNFDEIRLGTKGNVFINNKKGENVENSHLNKILGDLNVYGKLINKKGMILNYSFFKDDFNPTIPQECTNGSKRNSTLVTRQGFINGVGFNIDTPLSEVSTSSFDINVNGVKKDNIKILNETYAKYVKLDTPIKVGEGDAISLTIRSESSDDTLRQIQFTVEYEIF